MDSDRVLVIDAGTVAEYDKPTELLANPSGHFSQLVRAPRLSLCCPGS